MSWTNAVVTEAGLALQAKLVDGQTLGFLRVAAGTGTVDPASLANQTALVNEKQTLTFQPPNVLDGAKIKVPVMLNNIGLETGYTMQQLGFFADDPDDGEILYAIVQDEVGDTVPSQTESPGFIIEWAFVFQYGNAGSVTVTLDPVGLVSIGMVGQPGGVAGLGENGAVPIEQGGTGATTAQDAVDALGALFAIAAAAAYNPSGTYAVGDYCTVEGNLYKCNTPINGGEAWNAEHWTETSVAVELAEVHSLLAPLGGATTPQNALETLGAGVRPRLGVNMDFKINQRGEDTYTASSKTYTVDGWYLSSTGMGCNVANDQITITPNGDRYASFIQNLEENFKGKTLTFSALVSGTVGQTVGIALFDNKSSSSVQYARKTYVLNERMNLITVSAQIPEDSPGQRVLLYPDIANGTSPATFYHAKPEEGEGQTLAYQDSDGAWHLLPQPDSDYATQLAKCQRYFRRFPANYAMGVLQAAQGKNNACFRYECNPPMRTTPAVSMQNQSDLTNAIDDGDSPVTPLSVTLNWLSNENVVGFYFSGASGTGGPGFVCNRYIDASAEL